MAFDALSFRRQIPKNYNNLNHRKDKDLWEKAMIRKIESVNRNNT